MGTVAVDVWWQLYKKYLLWNGSGKKRLIPIFDTGFPCSNNSVLLASRCRSIYITIETIFQAFILETGMIIAVPDPDSKEFPYGSNVTYIAKFFKREEKSR